MSIGIQFISGMFETTTPVVKLTKSRNGNTGTATFIFYNPTTFRQWDNSIYPMRPVEGMYFVWVECLDFDKYGRLLANVYNLNTEIKSDNSFSSILLKEKLAYVYNGDTKLTEEEQVECLNK